MEWLIMTIGAKFCCIGASGIGGLANWAVKKVYQLAGSFTGYSCRMGSCGVFYPAGNEALGT